MKMSALIMCDQNKKKCNLSFAFSCLGSELDKLKFNLLICKNSITSYKSSLNFVVNMDA